MKVLLGRMVIFMALIFLVFFGLYLLTQSNVVSLSPQMGELDLHEQDLENSTITIRPNGWKYYPGKLYTPQEIANAAAQPQHETDEEEAEAMGTYRLVLHLPAGGHYAIAGNSLNVSQRTYINGVEMDEIGTLGTQADQVLPMAEYYIYAFTPQTDRTEIVVQYADFNYARSQGMREMVVGRYSNVQARSRAVIFRVCVTLGCAVAVFVFFGGMYLFWDRQRSFLSFALCCMVLAVWTPFASDNLYRLLFPRMSWYIAQDVEYIALALMFYFAVVFLNSIFPKLLQTPALWAQNIVTTAWILFVIVARPGVYSKYRVHYRVLMAVLALYVLVQFATRIRKNTLESKMIVFGSAFFLVGMGMDLVIMRDFGSVGGWGLTQSGMLVLMFCYTVGLVMQFARTESELNQAHRKEEELVRENELLDRLNRMKSEWVSNISHELKTPLAVMSGYAQLSAKKLERGINTPDVREKLMQVSSEANRLALLVTQLLQVNESWENSRGREPLYLQTIIEKMADMYCTLLDKQSNMLLLRIQSRLPTVYANEESVVQVLLNLLTNANRHTQNGIITIAAKQDADMVCVSVEDSGTGMEPDVLARLFTRYEKGTEGSTGLGLSICKEVIEAHGGRIQIDSSPGEGTIASFWLPAYNEEEKQ